VLPSYKNRLEAADQLYQSVCPYAALSLWVQPEGGDERPGNGSWNQSANIAKLAHCSKAT
jgi:hypothetical protein